MRAPIVVILMLGLLLPAVPASALQRYEAHYEQSEWTVTRTASRCEARHSVPRFGEVAFVQTAGSELAFRVEAYHRPPETQAVEVRTEVPEWRGGDEAEALGALPMEPQTPTVYVSRRAALMLLLELEAGRMPVLAYRDWTRPERSIEVVVSPIRFLPAVASFRECLAELPPPPITVAKVEPEEEAATPSSGATDAGDALDPDAAAAERRRQLKYRILSGGPRDEVRILLPEEAGGNGDAPGPSASDASAPSESPVGEPVAPPAE